MVPSVSNSNRSAYRFRSIMGVLGDWEVGRFVPLRDFLSDSSDLQGFFCGPSLFGGPALATILGTFDTRNCSILINASELGECGGNRVDFFLLRRERCECVLSVRSLRHNSYDKDSLV